MFIAPVEHYFHVYVYLKAVNSLISLSLSLRYKLIKSVGGVSLQGIIYKTFNGEINSRK